MLVNDALLASLLLLPPGSFLRWATAPAQELTDQYTVLVEDRAAVQALGIPTAVHYSKPVQHQTVHAHFCSLDACPERVIAGEQVLSLPINVDLGHAQRDGVVRAVVAELP